MCTKEKKQNKTKKNLRSKGLPSTDPTTYCSFSWIHFCSEGVYNLWPSSESACCKYIVMSCLFLSSLLMPGKIPNMTSWMSLWKDHMHSWPPSLSGYSVPPSCRTFFKGSEITAYFLFPLFKPYRSSPPKILTVNKHLEIRSHYVISLIFLLPNLSLVYTCIYLLLFQGEILSSLAQFNSSTCVP